MASQGKLAIQKMYDGKQEIVNVLTAKGIIADKDISLSALAALIDTHLPSIDPPAIPGEFGQQLSMAEATPYLPDLQNILAVNGIERDGKVPAYAVLLASQVHGDTFTNHSYQSGQAYLMSDGTWYNTATVSHTWNPADDIVSVDPEGSYEKYRWVIVYRDKNDNSEVSIRLYSYSLLGVVACILDKVNFNYLQFSSSSSTYYYKNIIEYMNITENTTSTYDATIAYLFYYAQKLRYFRLPDSLTTKASYVASAMTGTYGLLGFKVSPNYVDLFDGLSSFSDFRFDSGSLIIPSTATNIAGLSSLFGTYKIFPKTFVSNATAVTGFTNANFFKDNKMIEYVEVPLGVTSVGSGFLEGGTNLKRLVLPEGFTTCDRNFLYNCRQLERFNIPSTFVNEGANFTYYCYSVRWVDLPDNYNLDVHVIPRFTEFYALSEPFFRYMANKLIDNTGNVTKNIVFGPRNTYKISDEVLTIFSTKNYTIS